MNLGNLREMDATQMTHSLAEQAAATIASGIGRRRFAQAVAGLVAGVGVAGTASCSSGEASRGAASSATPTAGAGPILQSGTGNRAGDHYLTSAADKGLLSKLP